MTPPKSLNKTFFINKRVWENEDVHGRTWKTAQGNANVKKLHWQKFILSKLFSQDGTKWVDGRVRKMVDTKNKGIYLGSCPHGFSCLPRSFPVTISPNVRFTDLVFPSFPVVSCGNRVRRKDPFFHNGTSYQVKTISLSLSLTSLEVVCVRITERGKVVQSGQGGEKLSDWTIILSSHLMKDRDGD